MYWSSLFILHLHLLNFEDLIQKVNETIYSSHFYIPDQLTQIHKSIVDIALFIYHMQFLPESSGEYNVMMQ